MLYSNVTFILNLLRLKDLAFSFYKKVIVILLFYLKQTYRVHFVIQRLFFLASRAILQRKTNKQKSKNCDHRGACLVVVAVCRHRRRRCLR